MEVKFDPSHICPKACRVLSAWAAEREGVAVAISPVVRVHDGSDSPYSDEIAADVSWRNQCARITFSRFTDVRAGKAMERVWRDALDLVLRRMHLDATEWPEVAEGDMIAIDDKLAFVPPSERGWRRQNGDIFISPIAFGHFLRKLATRHLGVTFLSPGWTRKGSWFRVVRT